ncbi:MAG TPA: hypothetical protein VF163_00830 [Micromonosporaceae bacterium]
MTSVQRPVAGHLADALRRDGACAAALADLALPIEGRFWGDLPLALTEFPDQVALTQGFRFRKLEPRDLMRVHCLGPLLFGLDEPLLDLVEEYLGEPAAYLAAFIRKDYGSTDQSGVQWWHRDWEDRAVVRVIVYLTDVSGADGPFEYVPLSHAAQCEHLRERAGAHDEDLPDFDPVFDEELARSVPVACWQTCVGPAGTVLTADAARLLHHAKPAGPGRERVAVLYTYTTRRPRIPLTRSPALDDLLTARQRAACYLEL